MSNYRESQVRIDEAEAALRDGDEDRARSLFRAAAGLQRAFVDSLPTDRVRTRSIYGLSIATLLYRAGELEEVERLAHQLLAEPWIEPRAAAKLRVLLSQVWKAHAGSTQSPSRKPAHRLPAMGTGRLLNIQIEC
ncbi:MAG: hypothetical protein ABJE95_13085 [Byssovorax sp.]